MNNYTITDLNMNSQNKEDCVLGDLDCINASLYNLLCTVPGSDLFRPTRGVNIMAWLYQPFNLGTQLSYQNTINNQVKIWEPRVVQNTSNVSFDDSNRVLSITLSYTCIINGMQVPNKFTVNYSIT